MKKIAAIVVFYNPNIQETIENIATYGSLVDELIIVDNSSTKNDTLIQSIQEKYKITYIYNDDNLGIATALNIGCDKAIQLGFKWTLTMDQDSKFINFDFYKNAFDNLYDSNDIAIIAADNICLINFKNSLSSYFNENIIENSAKQYLIDLSITNSSTDYKEVDFAITSGNFLNLSLFNEIGRFEDKLFIDQVDFDYCAKAHLKNYRVIKFGDIKFIHELGYYKDGVPQHNYIRKYYIMRNMLYMSNKYGSHFPEYAKNHLLKGVRKNISHVWRKEEDRVRKVKSMLFGIMDYYLNKYGKKF